MNIIPVHPADSTPQSTSETTELRAALARRGQSRRTLGKGTPSRRTLGRGTPSVRTGL